jgi:hypothetical protein
MRDIAHVTRVGTTGETAHAYGPNLHLHGTPLGLSMLARLGHPDTHQPEVGRLAGRLFEHLFAEVANAELPVDIDRIPTRMTAAHPAEAYEGVVVRRSQRVVVVDVARAGILSAQLFYDRFNEALDPAGVRQDHMFVSRTKLSALFGFSLCTFIIFNCASFFITEHRRFFTSRLITFKTSWRDRYTCDLSTKC